MLEEKLRNSDDKFIQLVVHHARLARFIFTGGINTLCDLALYALLANIFAINPVYASIVSTGLTLVLSYFLNKIFVFRSERRHRSAAIRFVLVTLFNVWVVQSLILHSSLQVLHVLPFFVAHEWTANMAAKLCGVSVSMVLNYIGYRKIFREAS